MAVEFWPYWPAFGASLLWGAVIVFLTYSPREPIRQWRCIFMGFFYAAQAAGYGFLAFGQTYLVRSDGISILFGRWWLYLLTHPIGALVISIGISPMSANHLISLLATGISSAALVGLAYTPSSGGTNSEKNALIYWLIVCLVSALAAGVYQFVVAMGWRILPSEPYATEGRERVQSRFWYGLSVVLLTVGLMLYGMLAALGPEGWDEYTGSPNKREFTQIWVTLGLDCALWYIFMPAVYLLLDPSGATATAPFEALQPVNPKLNPTTFAESLSSTPTARDDGYSV